MSIPWATSVGRARLVPRGVGRQGGDPVTTVDGPVIEGTVMSATPGRMRTTHWSERFCVLVVMAGTADLG